MVKTYSTKNDDDLEATVDFSKMRQRWTWNLNMYSAIAGILSITLSNIIFCLRVVNSLEKGNPLKRTGQGGSIGGRFEDFPLY